MAPSGKRGPGLNVPNTILAEDSPAPLESVVLNDWSGLGNGTQMDRQTSGEEDLELLLKRLSHDLMSLGGSGN